MSKPPVRVEAFGAQYPEVYSAFKALGEACHAAGPLDEKTRKLVKVAISIGAGLEGATHSAVRRARESGVSEAELEHVAVLGVTTLGWPAAFRALTWVRDGLKKQ